MYTTVDEGQQYDTIYMPLCGHFSDDVLPIYAAKKKKTLKSIRIFCLCDFSMTDGRTDIFSTALIHLSKFKKQLVK